MRREKYRIAIKASLYGVLLFFLYILQITLFAQWPVFGARPMLLPVIAVCVALYEGPVRGGIFGLFAGMLCDIALNQPVGLFLLLLTAGGLLVGYFAETVIARGFPSCALCAVLLLVICTGAQMIQMAVTGSGTGVFHTWNVALVQVGYSVLFVFPFYYLARFLTRAVRV